MIWVNTINRLCKIVYPDTFGNGLIQIGIRIPIGVGMRFI